MIILLEPDDEGVFVARGELVNVWSQMPADEIVRSITDKWLPAGEVPAYACRIHESVTELEDERFRSSILESLCGSVPADLEAEVRERMGREISDELERLLLEGLKQSL